MGVEDHDRLRIAHEQGPGGHRGALAVRSCRTIRSTCSSIRRASSTRWSSSSTARSRHSSDSLTCAFPSSTPSPTRGAAPVLPRAGPPRATTADLRAARSRSASQRFASHARRARRGPRATAALIAADEVGVRRFLDGSLGFTGIAELRPGAVDRFGDGPPPDLEELIELDTEVRAWAMTADRQRTRRPAIVSHADLVLVCLAILVVLVVIHELGHFFVARRAHVRVHEFGIGFPPRGADPRPRQGDGLHAQLAAPRGLRSPGRGGGRVGRSARLREREAAHAPGHPVRRRGHELPARRR